MKWFAKQKAVEQRGNFRVTMDQNEMDFLNPTGYSDSLRGARAIRDHAKNRSSCLTYSIEKKNSRGFFDKIE